MMKPLQEAAKKKEWVNLFPQHLSGAEIAKSAVVINAHTPTIVAFDKDGKVIASQDCPLSFDGSTS